VYGPTRFIERTVECGHHLGEALQRPPLAGVDRATYREVFE
jgi:hypothetical protein